MATPLLSLLVGDFGRPEFSPARHSILRDTLALEASTLAKALELIGEDARPDLVIVACQRPGEHRWEPLRQLRQQLPITPIIAVLGSWCEGETRTGTPWPGVWRVFWHQFEAEWSLAHQQFTQGRCPPWGLPLTAGDEQQTLAWIGISTEPLQGLVAICARHADAGDSLADVCRQRNLASVWVRPGHPASVQGAVAGLWSGVQLDLQEQHELRHFAQQIFPAPVIALLDFPRVDTCERARQCGVTSVVAKPIRLAQLNWQLDRLLKPAPGAPVALK